MKVIKLSVGEDVNLSPADFIGKPILERLEELYTAKKHYSRIFKKNYFVIHDKNRELILKTQNAKTILNARL